MCTRNYNKSIPTTALDVYRPREGKEAMPLTSCKFIFSRKVFEK